MCTRVTVEHHLAFIPSTDTSLFTLATWLLCYKGELGSVLRYVYCLFSCGPSVTSDPAIVAVSRKLCLRVTEYDLSQLRVLTRGNPAAIEPGLLS